MRIDQDKRGDLAFDVGAIARAHDVELADESGRDALDGVRRQRPRQPVQRGVLVAVALDRERSIGLLEPHSGRNRHGQLALRPFHMQLFADVDFHAFRQRHRFFPDSRHNKALSVQRPALSLHRPPNKLTADR